MKMSWFKKTILFLHWLLSVLMAAIIVIHIVCPDIIQSGVNTVNSAIGGRYAGIVGIVILGLYVLLAITSVAFIFSGSQKRADRGFITVDCSESGRTRIAIGAVEQMIRQAVRSVEGVVDMKSSIVNCEDAISINANVVIANGAHVPTVTMNMQRAVRSYIELNCGVAVREVCVNVSALESDEENGRHGRRKLADKVRQSSNTVVNDVPSMDITQCAASEIVPADALTENINETQTIEEESVVEETVE